MAVRRCTVHPRRLLLRAKPLCALLLAGGTLETSSTLSPPPTLLRLSPATLSPRHAQGIASLNADFSRVDRSAASAALRSDLAAS